MKRAAVECPGGKGQKQQGNISTTCLIVCDTGFNPHKGK